MVEVSAGDVRKCYAGENLAYADVRMADVVRTLYATLAEYGLISGVDSFSIKNRFDISIRYQDKLDVYFGSIDNIDMSVLSMGMTNDYEVAVEEGATLVRVGTGIFGARNYNI